jgi:uncharacterized protein
MARLRLLEDRLAVCRLGPDAPVPDWAGGELTSITRTPSELSVVCAEAGVPADEVAERGWRALEVAGPLSFELTGVLASLSAPLAGARVSVFAIATYDTDYVLVKELDLERAAAALDAAGHTVES